MSKKTKLIWFALHWRDGRITYSKAKNIREAAGGISMGGLMALDYWEEASSLPKDEKEIYRLDDNGWKMVHPRTMFFDQAQKQILEGKDIIKISILRKELLYSVKENPFSFELREHKFLAGGEFVRHTEYKKTKIKTL